MKTTITLFLSLLFFTNFTIEKEQKVDAISSETGIKTKLNDGEKWKSDKETTASIEKLKVICATHFNTKTIDDELLKEQLTAEVNNLNRVTGLKGDARSQLHNFQWGIRNRINVISQDRETLKWLMDYLYTYDTYFE